MLIFQCAVLAEQAYEEIILWAERSVTSGIQTKSGHLSVDGDPHPGRTPQQKGH